MKVSLSRFRPLHLAGLTLLYWAGLIAVKLGGAVAWAWELSRLPQNHGAISAGLTNTVVHLSFSRDGVEVWAGHASLAELAAWIVGPPLLLALTARWMRQTEAAVDAVGPAEPLASLAAPPPTWPAPDRDALDAARPKPRGDDLR
jgi:hypothetical protein